MYRRPLARRDEAELYRSAIVMSWLGAMDVLHKHVHANYLATFNADLRMLADGSWPWKDQLDSPKCEDVLESDDKQNDI